jgi:hypothetical protein
MSPFLALGLVTRNPILALLDLNVAHEQLFFEDALLPSNLGFFDDGTIRSDFITTGYLPTDEGYDDCIMRKAAAQTQPPVPYSLLCRNCQTWARSVRETYARLAADPKIQEECGCKADARFSRAPSRVRMRSIDPLDEVRDSTVTKRQVIYGTPVPFRPPPIFIP